VAEKCHYQPNKYDTRQLCFDVRHPLPNYISVSNDFECSSLEQPYGAVLLQVYGANLSWVICLVVWQ